MLSSSPLTPLCSIMEIR
uniref:Uncharacterized protein n=1 Tax=Rhizophora mucronata TaxID=61149 RepID=A0A2P2NI71_RHIMU